MKNFRVTISGVDDQVKPQDLLFLSGEFPFVEWGVLCSDTRVGPRYPTQDWVKQLTALAIEHKMLLSRHVCGTMAKRVTQGEEIKVPMYGFGRCQINGFPINDGPLKLSFWWWEFILQMRQESDLPRLLEHIAAAPAGKISVLSDASQGRGVQRISWPAPPPGMAMGWAGGIGPDNIDQVLQQIIDNGSQVAWIDMESRVRDDRDQLDLQKVLQVLRSVAARYPELSTSPTPT